MRFSNALLGIEVDDYVPVAEAVEAAGFDVGRARPTTSSTPRSSTSKYPYTPDGVPQFPPDGSWPDPWVMTGACWPGRPRRCGS